ncbi:tripartite motif-containing protein 59-like, partial [Symsagittifera roscoffensis]|uniref:tripartite motif-containing protein 59-like n=1 Tax=Symsagittifera roscoffensis TaxID=84072 RepID=UPI00307B87D5
MAARDDKSYRCRLCKKMFVNPRMLPCGHSFCGPSGKQGSSNPTDCLGEYLKTRRERGSMVCPRGDCSSAISEPQCTSTDFPFNYPLYALVEQRKAELRSDGSEEECLDNNCLNKCSKHDLLKNYYCVKDKEAICNKCRMSSDHSGHADSETIITIEEARERQIKVKTGMEDVERLSNCTIRRLEEMTFDILEYQNEFLKLLLVEEQASSSLYESDHSFRVNTFRGDCLNKRSEE